MNHSNKSVLFLGKEKDLYCQKALEYCRKNFSSVDSFLGGWDQSLPSKVRSWQGDFIISYLSRWVVPENVLAQAAQVAINFHPASPAYPGIGCINFALYDEVSEYGATCHVMKGKVDTGEIVRVRYFPVYQNDTVETLLQRTYENQFELFIEIVDMLVEGNTLPESDKSWERVPYTRKEFSDLMTIRCDMDRAEIAKRIRATSFGEWQPRLEINGFLFKYDGSPS